MSDTQPAKPVSDAAEMARKLRSNAQVCRDEQARVDEYYRPELANNAREWDEAARTIEALQRENEAVKDALDRVCREFAEEYLMPRSLIQPDPLVTTHEGDQLQGVSE